MHFSLRDKNLVVRVQDNQTKEVLQLIPSEKLRGDLPPALVDGHVHWLNLTTKTIEIRPLGQLWHESSENWRIDCSPGQHRMYRGRETLLDVRSPTWTMVSNRFKHFNEAIKLSRALQAPSLDGTGLLVTTSPLDSVSMPRLSVALPCCSLSFFVNEWEELESRDFKDMVYDENKYSGVLFGLRSLLVLRPKTHIAGTLVPEGLIRRRVLIPNSFPRILSQTPAGHSSVDCLDEPLYHAYDVDTELGCLIGNGSPMSMRYLAYLHADTSCHRPDPLTGKTGVQAALFLLQSAGCRPVMKHKANDYDDSQTLTQRNHINAVHEKIKDTCYWDCAAYDQQAVGVSDSGKQATRPERTLSQMTLNQLFSSRSAPELPARRILPCDHPNTSLLDDTPPLDQLFSSLPTDLSFQREYLAHLDASAQCVRMEPRVGSRVAGDNLIGTLQEHYAQCRVKYIDSLKVLRKSLGPSMDPREQAIDRFGEWPLITGNVLLRYLASTSPVAIPPHWKNCLISLAMLLLDLQRARRLLRFALDGDNEEFAKELENEGCDGWNPEEYPDWLLIQVAWFCPNSRLY